MECHCRESIPFFPQKKIIIRILSNCIYNYCLELGGMEKKTHKRMYYVYLKHFKVYISTKKAKIIGKRYKFRRLSFDSRLVGL